MPATEAYVEAHNPSECAFEEKARERCNPFNGAVDRPFSERPIDN